MPEVLFNGPDGRLEGRYHQSKKEDAPIALILHPHPQYGGTMNNKVIYTLFQSFVRMDFSVLRFNFRSVGRSQGKFEGGPGELADAASALDWMQSLNQDSKVCWVAGYSFGAWIGMQLLMRRPEIGGFISVAPPANTKDFSFLAPCPSSGLIIQGGQDEIVPEQSVANLANKLNVQKNVDIEYEMMEDADHMFTDNLKNIHITTTKYVTQRMKKIPVIKPKRRNT